MRAERTLNDKNRFKRIVAAIKAGDDYVAPEGGAYTSYGKESVINYLNSLDPTTIDHSESVEIVDHNPINVKLITFILRFYYNEYKKSDPAKQQIITDKVKVYSSILTTKGCTLLELDNVFVESDYFIAKQMSIDLLKPKEDKLLNEQTELSKQILELKSQMAVAENKMKELSTQSLKHTTTRTKEEIIHLRVALKKIIETLKGIFTIIQDYHQEKNMYLNNSKEATSQIHTLEPKIKRTEEELKIKKEQAPQAAESLTSLSLSVASEVNAVLALDVTRYQEEMTLLKQRLENEQKLFEFLIYNEIRLSYLPFV